MPQSVKKQYKYDDYVISSLLSRLGIKFGKHSVNYNFNFVIYSQDIDFYNYINNLYEEGAEIYLVTR